MEEKLWNRIKELTELQAISNHENNVREYLADKMEGLVDSIETFGLGNIYGIRKSANQDAPTLMVAAHMDEVGFMVAKIHENGTMSVVPIGGWNPYAVSAQRYTLQTEKGDYPIISGAVSPHLLRGSKAASIKPEDVRFDAGFESAEEAAEYGVRPGDSIVPLTETILTANKQSIMSKAIDNRYGCAVILDALENTVDEALNHHLVIGANVQEEVGLRGARGAVHRYQPDLFFAVDCSPAGDAEGDKKAEGQLGQGFLLRMQDPGMLTHRGMIEFLRDTAEDCKIPYQYYFSKGGTDAGAAHLMNEGIPSAVIGLPARYIHGHQALFRISDYEAASEMLTQVIRRFDRTTFETIINK
ncbi:glutamyl aminopeptidase [Ignavigranum ruoffiae]|uniref:glutamyl aminopeptidase n=1 Tax=Ignavigranum ruoffiae TaxID=89093 RepID=UPI002056690B|nr:glutamyl aminopeptidase [Ignavigranum ruoffiae]UPQ85873.1 glutamyl aminopeptidase [Ignavigranum ruoffiae]